MNARLQLGFLAAGLLLLVGVACQDDGDSSPVVAATASSVEASADSQEASSGAAAASTPSQESSSDGAAAATTQASPSASVSTPAQSTQEAAPSVASADDGASQSGIWVSGTGTVAVAPDLAVLNVGVEARASTVQEALADAAAAMTNIVSILEGEGVETQDIQTRSFSITPEYTWQERIDTEGGGRYSERVLTGYSVSNRAVVRLRDLDRVGEMVDLVARAGGDLTRIEGVSFTVQDPEPHRAEAREAAVEQARAKAEQFARDAGVALGQIVLISEGGGNVPAPRAFAESAAFSLTADASTPISEGELEIRATVQMVFAIE